MTKLLLSLFLFSCLAVQCKTAIPQGNDSQSKLGAELSLGQPNKPLNLTVSIQNLGSEDISIESNGVSLFATKPSLNWPLRLWLATPTKIVTPHVRSNGPPEISDVDPNQSDGFRLKPGQSLLYQLNIQKIMTEREWSWSARPGPPKSPIVDGIGNRTSEPIALWVEILDENKWEGRLCSRPIMLYPDRYISKTANESSTDKK